MRKLTPISRLGSGIAGLWLFFMPPYLAVVSSLYEDLKCSSAIESIFIILVFISAMTLGAIFVSLSVNGAIPRFIKKLIGVE